jgi:hypothetical protein
MVPNRPPPPTLFYKPEEKYRHWNKGRCQVFAFRESENLEMLTGLDQNTIANMTAALESVCKKIPAGADSHDLRKRVADAMVACANSGTRTFVDFQTAGLKALEEMMSPSGTNWLGRLFRFAQVRSK